MTYPAAQAIQEAFPEMSEAEAAFTEVLLWYDSFENKGRMRVLKFNPDDLAIIIAKMNEARAEKDYRTSDCLRKVLTEVGVRVGNR